MSANRIPGDNGHSGPSHWKESKLTTEERIEIGHERMEGKGPMELAEKYGVSSGTIKGIAKTERP